MKLEIRNLRKSYRQKVVLKDINFTIEKGLYGILGPNGAGKSTLIKILTGNLESDQGDVFWNDKRVGVQLAEYFSVIGYAPQLLALYLEFTAWQYLDYIACLKNIPRNKRKEEIEWSLRQVELFDNRHERLRIFSGGMKQRILLAQAIMGRPQLLILDEPMNGLDPGQRMHIRHLLQKLDENSIVLVATHIVADIETVNGCIFILKNGKLMCTGYLTDIKIQLGKKGIQVNTLEEIYSYYCNDEEIDKC